MHRSQLATMSTLLGQHVIVFIVISILNAFSQISLIQAMKDKRELAVKKLDVVNDNQAEDAREEILALMNCQGPHILR